MKIPQLRRLASSIVQRFSTDPRVDIPSRIGIITGAIGLAADVGTPWGQFLGYLCAIVVSLAAISLLVCYIVKRRNSSSDFLQQLKRYSSTTATYAVFTTFVLLPIFALNTVLGSDRGLIAEAIPQIAELQDKLEVRLSAIEADMEDVAESVDEQADALREQAEALRQQARSLDAQADAIKEQTSSLEAQTTTLQEMRETIDVSAAFEAIDRARGAQNGAKFGQVEAIESLVDQGRSFQSSNFRGMSLVGLDFMKGEFGMSSFDLSDLSAADASEASLENAEFKFSTGSKDTRFVGTNLVGAEFSFSDFPDANFDGADLRGASFMGAVLAGASFVGANLHGATFEFANLTGADLRESNLENARFLGTILDNVRFDSATMRETDFLGARLSNTILGPEQISEACRSWDATPLVVRTLVVLNGSEGRTAINEYSESIFLVGNEENQWSLALCESGMISPDDYKNTYVEGGLSKQRIDEVNAKFNIFYERYRKLRELGQPLGIECLNPQILDDDRRKKPWLCRP